VAGPRKRTVALLAAALGALALIAPAGAGAYWQPPARPTFYWQLQGKLKSTVPAEVFDVDGFETTAAQVAALHAAGKHVVCYIDVGTAENFRPDYSEFPASVLGKSNGWPGERWLDVRALGVLEPIIRRRLATCAQKGFDAVEPDNIDGFENRTGFSITARQQLVFDEWVAEAVHGLGMAVLQKNDGEQAQAMEPSFDGVLTEQCNQYRECGDFAPYLQAGKPVINAEYKLARKRFCAADEAAGIVGARFNLALDGKRFQPCW
jgi:hypothetical protein